MAMRDFFRGDRDRDRDRIHWRDENRYGRQEDQRYQQYSQGRDWGRERDDEYSSYGEGYESPQVSGSSRRSEWRDEDYGQDFRLRPQERYGEQDWGYRDYGDRFRGEMRRGYGRGRDYMGGFYTGQTGRGEEYGGGRAGQYGGYGASQYRSGMFGERGGAGMAGMYRGRGPRGYRRSDERIYEDVCEYLTEDPMIDATNIEVEVRDGEITLSGMVNSRQEKRRAAEIIEDISGVKDVHNNIRVSSGEATSVQQSEQGLGTQAGQQAGQAQPKH